MNTVEVTGNYEDASGNRIIAPTGLKNVRATFKGRNNLVIISENCHASDTTFVFHAHEGAIVVGNSSKWSTLKGHINIGYRCLFMVGSNVTFTNGVYVTAAEETKIVIGDDCMFATGNQLRSDDAHAIYDINTLGRVNRSKDITIGAHTWIAFNAIILGGAQIGDGSVIGFNSVVKGKFPNNCTIAGTPAKVLKRDTAWERPHVMQTEPWIRDDATQIKRTDAYWRATDDAALPRLGAGHDRNMQLLAAHAPQSIWLSTPA